MLTPEKIAELKAAHGKNLLLTEVDELQIVTRPVGLKEWRAFKKSILGAEGHMVATENLLFSTLVYPAPDQLRAYLDRKPLAVTEIGGDVTDAAGTLLTWQSQGVDGDGNETLTVDDLVVKVSPVSGVAGRLYQQRLDDNETKAGAGEWLIQQVLVSPTWPELEARVAGRPFVLGSLSVLLAERAGRGVEVRSKKL